MKQCRKCGADSFRIESKTFSNGTEHLARYCNQCGRFADYAAKEIPPGMFIMPFGKYKGQSVQSVVVNDREYAEWLSERTQPALRARIERVIFEIDNQVDDGRHPVRLLSSQASISLLKED